MNALTREEMDAKLETIESRMDGRVTSIQASLDGFILLMDERARRTDERMDRMEAAIMATNAAISSLKTTVIVTAVSAVLATLFGFAGISATVLANMVASFESGKDTAAAQAEVKRQTEETAVLLRKMQAELDRRADTTPKN